MLHHCSRHSDHVSDCSRVDKRTMRNNNANRRRKTPQNDRKMHEEIAAQALGHLKRRLSFGSTTTEDTDASSLEDMLLVLEAEQEDYRPVIFSYQFGQHFI